MGSPEPSLMGTIQVKSPKGKKKVEKWAARDLRKASFAPKLKAAKEKIRKAKKAN